MIVGAARGNKYGRLIVAIPVSLASSLGPAADVEVRKALTLGGGGVGVPSGEVSAVAAVVLGGVPGIATAWNPHLSGKYSCSITGVFVHGSPKVDFVDHSGANRNCELGDLLVVVDEIRGNAIHDRRANLVQAKLTPPPGTFSLKLGGLIQLDLYRYWHPFTFTSKSFVKGLRDFNAAGTPGSPVDSGNFGGIDLVGSPRLWGQTVPAVTMSVASNPELGTFIADMATGAGGGRPATPGGTDDWSRTIDELLAVSGPLPSSFGVGLSTKKKRGVNAVAFQLHHSGIVTLYPMASRPAFTIIARDPPPPPDDNNRPPKDAISIIHVSFEQDG